MCCLDHGILIGYDLVWHCKILRNSYHLCYEDCDEYDCIN